ncbi:unnamed protein product [Ceratitis capitata]|uniref:(Mediterranean fruit fly) hypothetical protein n=1 Tax=Ceratitis capitata TaxID=7213 RepID=A0A811V6C7_CERCA|nr:unnamed protein product [Ceratitis capitata]
MEYLKLDATLNELHPTIYYSLFLEFAQKFVYRHISTVPFNRLFGLQHASNTNFIIPRASRVSGNKSSNNKKNGNMRALYSPTNDQKFECVAMQLSKDFIGQSMTIGESVYDLSVMESVDKQIFHLYIHRTSYICIHIYNIRVRIILLSPNSHAIHMRQTVITSNTSGFREE